MIPKGWINTNLGKHVKIHAGVAPANLSFTSIDGVPYVKVEDMNNCKKYQAHSRAHVTKSERVVPAGSVIFPKRGAAIMNNKVRITSIGIIIDTNMMALEANQTIISEYLYYLISHKKLFKIADTSTIPQINNKHILPYAFVAPPLEEQKRIAEILSTWDRAIEATEKLIAGSEAQKKALMQQLLTGKKRLPGFSGEWETVRLGTRGAFRKGRGISKADVRSAGLPCIRYGEIYTHHHDIVRSFNSYIDEAVAAESERINPGDILFTCSGETAEEIGKAVAYLDDHEAYAGGDIVIFAAHKDCPRFLGYLLNSKPLADQKARMGQGNSVVHISAANLGKLEFSLPDRAEQEEIAALLAALDDSLIILAAQAEALRKEKSALMQQLLTGKRRVKIKGEVNAA